LVGSSVESVVLLSVTLGHERTVEATVQLTVVKNPVAEPGTVPPPTIVPSEAVKVAPG
jgi:hypothetical protein